MQPDQILKYILDIETVLNKCNSDFNSFINDFMAVRTIERDLEIIGEAVNKMLKIDPSLKLTGAAHVVGLRNLIIHSYATVDPAILWGIINKDIPILKEEILELKG